VVVYERAIGGSHEIYDVLVSADGQAFEKIGSAEKGSRGDQNFVEHSFPAREIRFIKIVTHGCHGLTFPSFSRLSEVMAFAR
jgi:hexosaminidase